MYKKALLVFLVITLFIGVRAQAQSDTLASRLKGITIQSAAQFQNEKLCVVADFLSQQSKVPITVSPEIADTRVTLSLAAGQPLEDILNALAGTSQLEMKLLKKGIYLLKSHTFHSQKFVYTQGKPNLANSPSSPVGKPESMGQARISPFADVRADHWSTGTPNFNTEQYNYIADNRMLEVKNNPLSTFSIDVDTASYSNIRRFLNSGKLPPKDAVRIEELINYFTYNYAQPQDDTPFAVHSEFGTCPWNKDHQLVLVGLQGKHYDVDKLPPNNLVFLIDVSGSMDMPNKLPLVKKSFELLVKQMRPQDRVSIVVYAGAAGLVLESTPGNEKEKILNAINQLEAGGTTAGGAGIQLAYKIAKDNFIKSGNNRVILATDGDFNVGASSDGELIRMVEEKRTDGVFLTLLGFGMGNLKDSRMEQLADKGNGSYAYIDSFLEAKKVFGAQLAGSLFTIAKDVKLQIEFNPTKVKAYRLIGYENRVLSKEDFNDDRKDAGDLGAGHTVTALYEIVPASTSENISQVDPLEYQDIKIKPSHDLMMVKLRYKSPKQDVSQLLSFRVNDDARLAAMSENLTFAAAVAEFGMLLRGSEHKGKATYSQVLELARSAKGTDREGYRAEFIRMVEASQLLADVE